MKEANLPANELARLAQLDELDISGIENRAIFAIIVQLAAQVCAVPVALISLIDRDRQWLLSEFGWSGLLEMERSTAFCAHTILHPELMEVRDAKKDARFADNPLVTGAPHIQFYAGMPIITASGEELGTLCVIDNRPRQLNDAQKLTLRTLSEMVMALFETRRAARMAKQLVAVVDRSFSEIYLIDASSQEIVYINDAALKNINYTAAEAVGLKASAISAAYSSAVLMRFHQNGPDNLSGYRVLETTHRCKDGSTYPVQVRIQAAQDNDSSIWMSILNDLRTQKHDESRLLRTQRFYEAFARTNHAIIHSKNTEELFERICHIAVTLEMCDVAWIGMLHDKREIIPVASAGLPIERIRKLKYDLDDPVVRTHSVAVNAVLEGQPFLRNDYLSDATEEGWISAMQRGGIRSAGAFPLYRQERIVGVFAIGDAQAIYFNDELNALLSELASSISFFMDTEVREQARHAAEVAIRQAELRHRTLVDLSPDGIHIYQDRVPVFINGAGRQLFGATDADTIENFSYERLVHPDDWPVIQERLERLESGNSNPPVVVRGLRFDGSSFDMELLSSSFSHAGTTANMIVSRDVTQRMQRERLIVEQARILERAVRGEPLADILDRITKLVEQQTTGLISSIMLLTEDGLRLQYGAGDSLDPAFRAVIDGIKIGPAAGTCGTAAFRRELVVVSDIASSPLWKNLRKAALGHGLLASWSAPIHASNGDLVGIFSSYYRERRGPVGHESTIVGILSGVAAVAIERERNHRKLLMAQEQLLDAQRLARLGDWTLDFATKRFFGSDVVNDILGLVRGTPSISFEDYTELVHPLDRERLTSARDELFSRTREQLVIEYRILRKDGTTCHVEVRGQAMADIDGKPLNYTGIMQDITERKLAERMLVLNNRALESASSGIVIVDALLPDMPIISVNQAFERLTGYASHEVIGRNCRFLQGDQRNQGGLADIRAALAGKAEGHAVLLNYRKDGTPFWIDLKIAPVKDADGAVTHFIGNQTDVSDGVRFEKELAFQASHDALTGLPNRTLLEDRLAQVLNFANRHACMAGVAFVDLDHFKGINDTLGHNMGDRLLKIAAQRFTSSLRDGDTVSRFGGDEFVVICPDIASLSDMEEIIARIYKNLRAPLSIDGHEIRVDASIGVALYPNDGETAGELLKCADMAMYHAKASGRSTSQFYAAEMGVKVSQKRKIERELHQALERGEFVLHYQPKTNAKSGRISGMEALIRWNHPQRGLVSPIEFIQIAEESNLIVPIGEWVMFEACRQNQAWHLAGLSNFPVAVNTSMAQFKHQDFGATVMRSLARSGMSPHLLELEITESLAVEHPELFIATLERIKAIGVRIAIDDFGTGYSSLSYIKRFPIDVLKIDRSFVRDITVDTYDAAICRTIINLAHNLKLSVVAEGVETEEQANYLKRYYCDELQGFLLYRPESAAAITARLEAARQLPDR